jgi:hypothetical protein
MQYRTEVVLQILRVIDADDPPSPKPVIVKKRKRVEVVEIDSDSEDGGEVSGSGSGSRKSNESRMAKRINFLEVSRTAPEVGWS